MKNIFKNVLIVVISVLLSFVLADATGNLYLKVFPKESAGSFVGSVSLIGLPLAYIFSLILLFTAFGGTKKYWYIGIGLVPAVLFEVAFDWQHIYFPIALGLIAWVLGRGLGGLIKKFKRSKSSIGPLDK